MKKLIFIDDSPVDHFILKRILNEYQLNYQVSCTANGHEVIDLLVKHQREPAALPDIILLDLYMPGFDGWEFLEQAQRICSRLAKPLRIYILSSSINPEDLQLTKQYACVSSFIFKPITRAALEKLLKGEISRSA